jgi:hypothetical protein
MGKNEEKYVMENISSVCFSYKLLWLLNQRERGMRERSEACESKGIQDKKIISLKIIQNKTIYETYS